MVSSISSQQKKFQSTLSMRRATCPLFPVIMIVPEFQSTLSMRRATCGVGQAEQEHDISIHALHEESDPSSKRHPRMMDISIHALHEESDWALPSPSSSTTDFNPRSP